MLSYRLLRNHAGLMLIGDYTSLRLLHEVVHEVNDRSPLIKEESGPFLALAYDVRKAYEQQREVVAPPPERQEIGTQFGVKILWPVLLVQQRMLRVSLSYLDSSKWLQAMTYALEGVIEDGLKDDFGIKDASSLIYWWQRIDPVDPGLFDRLDSRGAIFCSWSKAERKRQFGALLSSFDPRYEQSYAYRTRVEELDSLSPTNLARWSKVEWPPPRW